MLTSNIKKNQNETLMKEYKILLLVLFFLRKLINPSLSHLTYKMYQIFYQRLSVSVNIKKKSTCLLVLCLF